MPTRPERAWTSLRPSAPLLAGSVLLSALAGLFAVAPLWCAARLVEDPRAGWAAAAAACWLVAALAAAAAAWLAHTAEAGFEARLRRRLALHVTALPSTALARLPGTRARQLLGGDVAALHHLVAHLPGEVAVLLVAPAAATAGLLLTAGPAGLLALLPGAAAALFHLVVIPRRSGAHAAERAQVVGRITTAVDDYARGVQVARVFGADAGAARDYRQATEAFAAGMTAWVRRVATPAAIVVALLQPAATLALAYLVGARLDAGALAAVLLLSLALVAPALRLGHGLDYVAAGRAAASRLDALLREPTLLAGTRSAPAGPVAVALDGVAVAIDGRPLVTAVTHRFEPSTLTAVVGPSGAGKSTLLRLLGRQLDPTAGAVRANGVDYRELALEETHRLVVTVPQTPGALPRTVRANLALARPGASDDALVAALRAAALELPLDAAAERLSGGERQRLAIARALLGPAPVLLLDEPTSALDAATAIRLFETLRQLAREQRRTLVVVTHDRALAARADAVLSVASGRAAVAREALA